MAVIVVAVLVFAILIYLCSMSGYTTKRKNPDDYMESIHFNTFFNCHMKDFTKLISAFTKADIKVSFYYKEPKEDKKYGKK